MRSLRALMSPSRLPRTGSAAAILKWSPRRRGAAWNKPSLNDSWKAAPKASSAPTAHGFLGRESKRVVVGVCNFPLFLTGSMRPRTRSSCFNTPVESHSPPHLRLSRPARLHEPDRVGRDNGPNLTIDTSPARHKHQVAQTEEAPTSGASAPHAVRALSQARRRTATARRRCRPRASRRRGVP